MTWEAELKGWDLESLSSRGVRGMYEDGDDESIVSTLERLDTGRTHLGSTQQVTRTSV